MVRRRVAMAVVVAGLAIPATASAGGWATVGVDPPPGATPPGTPWNVELTLLQHGRTPLEDVEPAVRIARPDGTAWRSFPASPAGRPGVYRARVVFPAAGAWRYTVDDGFSAEHEFAPVSIRSSAATAPAPSGGGGDGGPDPWPLVAAIAAALAASALVARGAMRGPGAAGG